MRSLKKEINVRKAIFTLVSILGLLLPPITQAQGTTYLSNLSDPTITNVALGSDSWIAAGFGTGPNAGGYLLDSVQLLLGAASGNPAGFSVAIYSKSGNSPQNNLGNLIGADDPAAGGVYLYTASGLALSRSTPYYVVVTAATPVAQGAYSWAAASNPAPFNSFGWGGGVYDYSADGSTWNYFRVDFPQFAINATAVPEPSTLALAGLGLAALRLWRFRQGKGIPKNRRMRIGQPQPWPIRSE